ncbi:MAG: Calx-beta domain-containing protein, partial [bacterium]
MNTLLKILKSKFFLVPFVLGVGSLFTVLLGTSDNCYTTEDGDLTSQSVYGEYQGTTQSSACGTDLSLNYFITQGTSIFWSGFGSTIGNVQVANDSTLAINGNANFVGTLTNAGTIKVEPPAAPPTPTAPNSELYNITAPGGASGGHTSEEGTTSTFTVKLKNSPALATPGEATAPNSNFFNISAPNSNVSGHTNEAGAASTFTVKLKSTPAPATPATPTIPNSNYFTFTAPTSNVSGHTNEAGAASTFTVKLKNSPAPATPAAPTIPTSDFFTFTAPTSNASGHTKESGTTSTFTVKLKKPLELETPPTATEMNEFLTLTGEGQGDYNYDVTIESADGGHTSEAGTQSTIKVALDHEPEEDMTVSVTSSNTNIATVNPATLTFTPGNYQQTQNVIVSGVDNTISDGHQPFAINLTAEKEHHEMGDNWTRQTVANSQKDLLGVAFGNNKYVAVGKNGKIFVSQDASQGSWAAPTTNPENTFNRLNSVTFGNGMFVAVGNNGTILNSADADTWTKQANAEGDIELNNVEFLNGNFLVLGEKKVLKSTTGANGSWTTVDTGANGNLQASTFLSSSNKYVVVGNLGTFMTSPDLTAWTQSNTYSSNPNETVEENILDVSSSFSGPEGDTLIALGQDGNLFMSQDANNWTQTQNMGSNFASPVVAITFANYHLVAVGPSGAIFSAQDPNNWQPVSNDFTEDLNYITHVNGKFIAVGNQSEIVINTDRIEIHKHKANISLFNLDNDLDVTVDLSSSNTAEATITPATLTFTPAGQKKWDTPQTLTVTGVNDDDSDGHKAFQINASANNVLRNSPPVNSFASGFNQPRFVTSDGTNLYVSDTDNHVIRKVVIATGAVSIFAGSIGAPGPDNGTGAAARFKNPQGIVTDGTNIYVADNGNHVIRKIVIASAEVTTIAGVAGGPGSSDSFDQSGPTTPKFNGPKGITFVGTSLYVSDAGNHTIRRVSTSSGHVGTIAGTAGAAGWTDGNGQSAKFDMPYGMTSVGSDIYVADHENAVIRKIDTLSSVVTTFAGTAGDHNTANGQGTSAKFKGPTGITTDGMNLYVTEHAGKVIRKIVISSKEVTTIAGSGTSGSNDADGTSATFAGPYGITYHQSNLYVADRENNKIRKVALRGTETSNLSIHNLDDDAEVKVALASSNTGEATVNPAELTFNEGDWNTAQTVTVTGVNDNQEDGHKSFNVSVSADTGSTSVLSIHNLDDDAEVKVAVASSNTNEATVNPAELTFNEGNWNTAQTVTTTGVNDNQADGHKAYKISLSGGTATAEINLYNIDDDTDVKVAVASSNTGEATVNPAELTFTEGNWDTAQTVTVTGVNDDNPDGKQQYQVSLSSRLGQNPEKLLLYNMDDDYPDIPQIAVTGSLSNSGTITAKNSVVTLSGGAAMTGGTLDISDSTVNLSSNFTKTGGTLTSDTATLKLTNSASITSNNAVSFKALDLNNKVLTLGSGTSDLTVTNAVTLDAQAEEIIAGSADLTLTGGFTLTNGKITSSGGVVGVGNASTIGADGTMKISGGGVVLNAALSVAGVLQTENSPTFTLNNNALDLSGGQAAAGGVLEASGLLNLGGITFDQKSTIKLNADTELISAAPITVKTVDMGTYGLKLGSATTDLTISENLTINQGQNTGIDTGSADLTLNSPVTVLGGGFKSIGGTITFGTNSGATSFAENTGMELTDTVLVLQTDVNIRDLMIAGTSTVSIAAGKTLSGAVTVSSGTLKLDKTGTLASNISMSGGTLGADETLTLSGALTQTGNITIAVAENKTLVYSGAAVNLGAKTLTMSGKGIFNNTNALVLNDANSKLLLSNTATVG